MPLSEVEDLVDTRLAPKISQLSGVGLVTISGGQKPAVRIQVNPTALSSYGINLEDLRTAVTQTSVNAAKGNFDGPRQDYQIDANDQLVTSEDYQERGGRVPQRRAGDADRRGKDRGWRGKHEPGGVDELDACGDSERAAAAGRQHDQRRQEHSETDAAARGQSAHGH